MVYSRRKYSMSKKYEIKYQHFIWQYGRSICAGNLVLIDGEQETTIQQGPISHILSYARDNEIVIDNAQDILEFLVLDHGAAS